MQQEAAPAVHLTIIVRHCVIQSIQEVSQALPLRPYRITIHEGGHTRDMRRQVFTAGSKMFSTYEHLTQKPT
jgi:hypothetical protein